jgi:hypothetical protein
LHPVNFCDEAKLCYVHRSYIIHYPDDGNSKLVRNVCQLVPDCPMLHYRRQSSLLRIYQRYANLTVVDTIFFSLSFYRRDNEIISMPVKKWLIFLMIRSVLVKVDRFSRSRQGAVLHSTASNSLHFIGSSW